MALAASLLRSEMRRHLLMNLGLVATCVVGGTVVTNERGLFIPIGFTGVSETAKAFSAMFTPSHLLPEQPHNVAMMAPLEPFDVTADSRDLRRRLMDAFNGLAGPANQYNDQVAGLTPLSPTEYADATPSGSGPETPADTAKDATSGPGSPFNPTPPFTIVPGGNPPDVLNPGGPNGGGVPAIPEPSMWAMLVMGFGAVGSVLRAAQRRRREARGAAKA